MSVKINTVQVDDELSEDNKKLLKLSEVPWREYLAEQNYSKNINTMCEECIADQIKTHGSQVIPCKGLNEAKVQLGDEIYDEITKDYDSSQIEMLESLYDPYAYMEAYLDIEKKGKPERRFKRRWYQERILKCSARNKVIRMGRRCIPGYEKVLTVDGYRRIDSLKIGDNVITWDKNKSIIKPITNIWENGFKPVFRITLANGKKIDCTSNHPLLVYKNNSQVWLSIDNGLKVGNTVTIKTEEDYEYSSIKSITNVGTMSTYDLSIKDSHNYIVNDIVTHNTGKTMAIAVLILHRVMTTENYRILLVSPFAVQTEEIVDNLKNLCALLPENPLMSSKASPAHVLTFSSGAIVKGFTAGTDGNSIRGQPGDLLILDELDDIPSKAMISIMGIKMDNPDVEIWRSGTPKGEVNLYAAEQDPSNKAFHYPSFVIPHWNDAMDRELREDLGEVGFLQEVMAIFGVVSNGVFQTTFINRAQQRPNFVSATDVLKDRNRFIITIGVDWNHDQVGTRIVVIAYDKLNPQFRIIEKAAIAQVGYTQQAAMEKIIHLNRKYNCDHIFCDEGFGATQIGDLKRVGESAVGTLPKGHPDLKLLDVQAVNFSSNTEIRDPQSGDIYKTPTKQFAVQNTVVMLERDMLSLHPKEDNDIILQMKNYIEKSRNKGKIVYSYISKKIGDHDLDALMIGLYGYRKIYSSLFEGSVFQAMIKFANKSDPNAIDSNQESVVTDDVLPYVQLKFGKTSKNFSSRTSKIGGLHSRNRSTIK